MFVERFTGLSLFVGSVCALAFSGLNLLVLVANRNPPGRLPQSPWLAAAMLATMAVAFGWAYRWYGRLPEHE